MSRITVNFAKTAGPVKPMHAVNNGPVYKFAADQRITNIKAFQDAGIPFARNHDASFCSAYGGEHTVDVHRIFRDFSKDVNDPASYDFVCTDEYIRVCEYAGVRTFYRLGSRIEHEIKKYGTLPPPDFRKWAEICEHIIRHYTEGWADGFRYDIPYWEIWNEADLDPDDSPNKRNWGGTKAQFFDLYEITAKHLKACFPHLKIGGPAVSRVSSNWTADFIAHCRDRKIPLDFFSWHRYARTPEELAEDAHTARKLLDGCGFTETESILDEWNYVKGWEDEEWIYSLRTERNLKGSAFIASAIESLSGEPLDMLMYYDARPCGMNGMFDHIIVSDILKGYYPFWMFNHLYKMTSAVTPEISGKHLYATAAIGEKSAALMLTHYRDADRAESENADICLQNLPFKHCRITFFCLDAEHDGTPVREEIFSDGDTLSLDLPLFSTYLLMVSPADGSAEKIFSE